MEFLDPHSRVSLVIYVMTSINSVYMENLEKCYVLCVLCLAAQFCPTLCDPKDVARQVLLSMGIFQGRLLEWVAMSSSRESSHPRGQTQVSHIASTLFTIWATTEAQKSGIDDLICKIGLLHVCACMLSRFSHV